MKRNKHILLISPTHQIAKYWGKEMGINYYKTITDLEHFRGLDLKSWSVIFVEGEPFDYPEDVLDSELRRDFIYMCDYIQSELKRKNLQGE